MDLLKREQIKDRMIRLAAEHWQVQENEIDANFDPLLILLFDVLAGEIEGIGYHIRDIQNTLLNELSALMLPQSLLRARPASCIITAQPNEKTCILNKENNFTTIAQTAKPGTASKEVVLNFTPIGEVKLLQLTTGHIRIGNKVYKYFPDGKKIPVHEEAQNKDLINEIHFTIHGKDSFDLLEGLQLYFDLKGHSEANNFYFAVQNGSLNINGAAVDFTKGYYNNDQYTTNIKDAFNRDNDYSRKIQKDVAGIYAAQFITLTDMVIAKKPATYVMLEGLPDKQITEINLPGTIFCTVTLSRHFTPEVAERLQIGINAFPAINRKLEKLYFKTDKWINIIPLPVKDSYLDMHSIEGLDGYKYKLHPGEKKEGVAEGEAIIRIARVGKNNSRDVRNTIKSLLETIRDESAYFSRTSNDFISSRLNEISKILTGLEDQVQSSKDEKPTFQYALLRAQKDGENVLVQYWTTAPEDASFIKTSAVFKPSLHSYVNTANCFSLTTASGGVSNTSDYSQKQMLVKQLSSRGKIISVEDIKLLCYELFGTKLKSVSVQKKMKIMQGSKAGITRMIEIVIQTKQNDFITDELIYLEKQLRYQLDTNASFMFPFEIRIESV